MTVQMLKTKAEQALAPSSRKCVDMLPGAPPCSGHGEAAIARFRAIGLPHRRMEEWKFTDLAA